MRKNLKRFGYKHIKKSKSKKYKYFNVLQRHFLICRKIKKRVDKKVY